MAKRLGEMEMKVIAYAQARKIRTIRAGDLLKPFRITAKQERELLARLARKKLITRIRRGLYLLPEQLPSGALWSASPIETMNALMSDKGGRYQICGLEAFNRYGYSTQLPQMMYVYNNRISGRRTIGSFDYVLIKVSDDRLGGTEETETPYGKAVYSSRVRSLIDAVRDYKTFNTLPRAYRWILADLQEKKITADELVNTALDYGDKATIRRIGVLLEMEGGSQELLRKLERRLPKSSGLISWIPSLPRRGKKNKRWGIIYNADDKWRVSSDS